MTKKLRADQLLVERRLIESREKAKRLVLAGKVFAQNQRVQKPSDLLGADIRLEIRRSRQQKMVTSNLSQNALKK